MMQHNFSPHIWLLRPKGLIFAVLSCVVLMDASFLHAETQHAIITTVDSRELKGSYTWIQESKSGGSRLNAHNMMPTVSAIRAATYGQYYYILEGDGLNRVTLFDIVSLDTQVWQYTAQDAGETTDALPWDLVFVDEEKAYLLRYGSSVAWIVNPLSETEAGFKIGELDFSVYDDGDGSPEMFGGVLVGSKAFIALKRIDAGGVPQTVYLAVIDTATDTSIDTGQDAGALPGIPLAVKNPVSIQYSAKTGRIYVQGCGAIDPAPDYTGGIEQIDPATYATAMVVDDGTEADHPYGYITGMAIVSATDGFFISAATKNEHTLYHFNPGTGVAEAMLFNSTDSNYMKHKKFAGLSGGVGLDQHYRLWISNITDRQVEIINTTPNLGLYGKDGSVTIPNDNAGLAMEPVQIVFCKEPAVTDEEEAEKPSSSGDSGNFCFIGSLGGRH